MTLTIRDDARREIQKDVNALTQSPRHHLIKVERARTYFPVIEKVFEEERIPDDFKYLVLQESALIADAVSVSNAVGFWQFKDFTAVEMGLRVDKDIDERLNIVSSTRAAARYIKKNNTVFDNWIYALQAYQMGAGGVMRSVDKGEYGKTSMQITSGTYWYVKKFLAHKIAFESSVTGPGQIRVVSYVNSTDRNLKDLAREVAVDETELLTYNKWAKKGLIPGDRQYTVMIPMKGDGIPPQPVTQQVASVTSAPAAAKPETTSALKGRTKINGISAIRPVANETPAALAARAGVEVGDFLKWNDISLRDRLQEDTYYLLGKKRTRATSNYHTAETGEDMWKISQRYGVQLKKLKRFNRMSGNELQPGTTVWLSSMKPKNAPEKTSAVAGPVVQVDDDKSFAWTADPSGESVNVVSEPVRESKSTPDGVQLERSNAGDQSVAVVTVAGVGASTTNESTEASNQTSKTEHHTSGGDPGSGPSLPAQNATSDIQTIEFAADTSNEDVSTSVVVTSSASTGTAAPGTPVTITPAGSIQSAASTPGTGATLPSVTVVTPPDSVGPLNPIPTPALKATHTVKAGETLYGIAKEHGVGVMDLVNWNDLNLQEGIKPGLVLKLRSPEQEQAIALAGNAITIEHVVKATDTLYSVARRYNVTIKELMDWNNKKDFNLAIGEKLIVKGR